VAKVARSFRPRFGGGLFGDALQAGRVGMMGAAFAASSAASAAGTLPAGQLLPGGR